MKELENQMKKAQKEASKVREGLNKLKSRHDVLGAEVENLQRDVKSLTEQLVISNATVTKYTGEIVAMETKVINSDSFYYFIINQC